MMNDDLNQMKPHARETRSYFLFSPSSSLATLLLGDTDSPAATTRRLGVLATDTEAPVVSETTVGADLLQALEIVAQLRVDAVRQDLRVLAIGDIALSVEEPCRGLLGI